MMGRIEANNGRRENSPNNNKTIERAELGSHNQSVRVNEQMRKTVTTDRLEKNLRGKDITGFCRFVQREKRFGRKRYLHVQSRLQIEETGSSKTSVPIYEATWRHTTQTIFFGSLRRQSLNSHMQYNVPGSNPETDYWLPCNISWRTSFSVGKGSYLIHFLSPSR